MSEARIDDSAVSFETVQAGALHFTKAPTGVANSNVEESDRTICDDISNQK
jgi:hypothetical protein